MVINFKEPSFEFVVYEDIKPKDLETVPLNFAHVNHLFLLSQYEGMNSNESLGATLLDLLKQVIRIYSQTFQSNHQ